MAKLGAGDLRDRVQLQRPGIVDDGHGNAVPAGDFVAEFEVSANLRPLRGGEPLIQGRLQGRQVYAMTVRRSSMTRRIASSWRAIDMRQPERVFAIVSPGIDPDGSRAWLEFLVEEGGVT